MLGCQQMLTQLKFGQPVEAALAMRAAPDPIEKLVSLGIEKGDLRVQSAVKAADQRREHMRVRIGPTRGIKGGP